MRWCRAWAGVVAALLGCLAAAGRAAAADEEQVWTAFRGQIVFSDVLIAQASDFPSGTVMVAALRRLERPVVDGHDGFWRFHFVAFLDRAPQSAMLRIVATDVTSPKQRREVKVFEVGADPAARELHMNDFVLTDAMGFERGHRYEIAILPGADTGAIGKQDVYARGVLTLK